MIGDITGKAAFGPPAARSEQRTETGQDCRRNPSLNDHVRRQFVEPVHGSLRAPLTIPFDRAAVQ
jgi:hypothetical protein